jgi:predicted transcriptional regulator
VRARALPYHIPIMRSEELAQLDNFNHSRRYSYADMLRKPRTTT